MKVFISGASGLIGGNCLQHFLEKGCEVIGSYFSFKTDHTFYFDTLNISNPDNFDLISFKPDVIIHCGALTHVDYCESHEEESFQKTVISTQNLLELATTIGANFVYISTDYVFDGSGGPYHEADPVNPLSVYANHKLQAEQMVLASGETNLVLRVTNVYGHEIRNKNFVSRIISQCLAKESISLTVPFDQYATPVNALDVAKAMYLLLRDHQSGIFHIASTDFMNRVELSQRVLKHFPDAIYTLNPVSTEMMKQPALRPLIGGLQKSKFSSLYPDFLFSTVDDFVQGFL